MSEPTASEYALEAKAVGSFAAPELPYRPKSPKTYRPQIGLIGCGGISQAHLEAYKKAGFDVVALCDKSLEKAQRRAAEFFPEARTTSDPDGLINDSSIDVLDITPHPEDRLPLIRAALEAGKHVLSQKPFVLDLDEGERLCALAQRRGVKLAVNQNGRWAPHFAYIREAVGKGLIGEVLSVHVAVHWDHTWTAGTPFEEVEDLVFFDFGIHWFDFVASLIGDRARRVQASRTYAAGQKMKPPMLAQAILELEGGQASLVFDAHTRFGPLDATYVAGSKGTLTSSGPDLGNQTVTLHTEAGRAVPELQGAWFNDGFHGAMGELLCSVEEQREPLNSARGNLKSLELCFAAIAAARSGTAQRPGEVRSLKALTGG
ncbi:MAG: gfo/Idh/MocA family oxidoreductase [Meiothermus sp.]